MPSLLTIPCELRNHICTYALLAQRNEPPSLDKSFDELVKTQVKYTRPRLRAWSDNVLYSPENIVSNATSLLLVNHQLHAETLHNLKLIPEASTYDLDVIILDEILPLATWLRIPALTTSVDVLNATFRISGCYDPTKELCGESYSEFESYKGWRIGDGAGPAMTWQIYSLLERFIRVGPTGERATENEHRHVTVKTLCINVKSPPNIGPNRFHGPRSGHYRRGEYILDPKYLVLFLNRQINGLLSGGGRSEWFEYGKILYEHVDEILVSHDNEHIRTWDIAKHLRDVGGFEERYVSAEQLKEYKSKTWQLRKARGLRVLEG